MSYYNLTIFDSKSLLRLDPASEQYKKEYQNLLIKNSRPDHPLPEFDTYLVALKPFVSMGGYKPEVVNGVIFTYVESNERGDYLRPPWHKRNSWVVDDFGDLVVLNAGSYWQCLAAGVRDQELFKVLQDYGRYKS